jgi:hypothetical protein
LAFQIPVSLWTEEEAVAKTEVEAETTILRKLQPCQLPANQKKILWTFVPPASLKMKTDVDTEMKN